MIETTVPFDPARRVLGISALGPWIVVRRRVDPEPPDRDAARRAHRGHDVAARATRSTPARLDFVTAPWQQARGLARRSTICWRCSRTSSARRLRHGLPGADGAGTGQLPPRVADRRRRHGRGVEGESPDAGARGRDQAREADRRPASARQADMFVKRFRREANVIAGLQSPHTVYLYDFGISQDGRFYYVMELLDGISLQTLVATFGPQPAARVVAHPPPDLQLARGGAPAGAGAPRSEAVERDALQGRADARLRQGARLRPREIASRARTCRSSRWRASPPARPATSRRKSRSATRRRWARRPLRARLRRLLPAHRDARVPRPESDEHGAQARAGSRRTRRRSARNCRFRRRSSGS